MTRKILTLVICTIFTTLSSLAQTPPDNEVWYTTTDGKILNVEIVDEFNGLDSHYYESGKGVIRTTDPIKIIFEGRDGQWCLHFYGCTNLKTIIIPNAVEYISSDSFIGCTNLESFSGKYASADGRCLIVDGELIAFAPAGLTSYTIPDSVTKIGWHTFKGCISLTSYTIPDSVTKIGGHAFYGCKSLKSITIPDSVTEISGSAFYDCTSLTSITIPDSVTKIEAVAFLGCTGLKSFKGKYASADGRCLIQDGVLFAFAPAGLTSYTIPDSVTWIGDFAFEDCTGLTSITIPDSVTEIGYGAFRDCTSLKSITIPNSITEIGEDAFSGCDIKEITLEYVNQSNGLPEGLSPEMVTKLMLANNITSVNSKEMSQLLNLKHLTVDTNYFQANWIDLSNIEEITIGENVSKLAYGALTGFSGRLTLNCERITKDITQGINISEVTIGNDVENIEIGAFDKCTNLRKFNGKYASADGRCIVKDGVLIDVITKGLLSYDIPDGVTTISDDTFRGCTELVTLTLPQSLTTIGSRAFMGCSALTQITIPNGVTTIKASTFKGCTNLKSIELSNKITTIGSSAFMGCCSLQGITIPDSTTTIGTKAFEDCRSLTEVAIPNGVTTIKASTFEGCTNLSDIKISDKLTTIGESAFVECNITSITIPQDVTTIGKDAFKECPSSLVIKCLATTPPQISTLGIGGEIVIYVPKESINLYKKAEGWEVYKKQIKRIKE